MYRILFFVCVFLALIPIVWKLVNKVFSKVSNELSKEKENASDVIDAFVRQKNALAERQSQLEREAERAKNEVSKLDNFSSGNENNENQQQE